MNGRALPLAVLCFLLLFPAAVRAQLPHLDPLPHFSAADSTSRLAAVFEIDRNEEPDFGWSLNRLLLTAILPAGGRAAWFLRLPVMSFDTGRVSVGERWPGVLGTEQDPGWPHESIISGVGQLEVGITGPVGAWFMRRWRYGVGLGLPTAGNALYPWSAGGLPLRLQLRPGVSLGGGRHLWLLGGVVAHVDASGDDLAPGAFPDGTQLGAEFAWYLDRGRRWTVSWDSDRREGRRSQLLGVAAWFPWTGTASVGLRVRTEITGSSDRPAAWYATLAFRFDGRPAADAVPAPTE